MGVSLENPAIVFFRDRPICSAVSNIGAACRHSINASLIVVYRVWAYRGLDSVTLAIDQTTSIRHAKTPASVAKRLARGRDRFVSQPRRRWMLIPKRLGKRGGALYPAFLARAADRSAKGLPRRMVQVLRSSGHSSLLFGPIWLDRCGVRPMRVLHTIKLRPKGMLVQTLARVNRRPHRRDQKASRAEGRSKE